MRSEDVTSLDNAELTRCLAVCVCGGMLISAAVYLRDSGRLRGDFDENGDRKQKGYQSPIYLCAATKAQDRKGE